MSSRSHRLGAVSLSLLAATAMACSAGPASEATATADGELTASWFAANLPKGSAEERAVLALVNDRSMSADEYVETCDFSLAVSAAIVDYRQGDEPADTSDDETFDTAAELDRLPFTDRPFWAAALACAKEHYLGSGGTCATGTSAVQQAPLAIQVVLDGSGSMMGGVGGGKWDAATGALTALFDAQAQKADPKVGMGLVTFSDTKDGTNGYGPYPSASDVLLASVDAAHGAALRGRLEGARPGGGTPLYAAVTGAYGALSSFAPTGVLASPTKVVVLLTDGVPNDHAEELVTFVGDHADEAQLFAVGIGSDRRSGDYHPDYVSRLAVAGGTRRSASCSTAQSADVADMCHLQVTPGAKPASAIKDELLAAFEKVRSDVTACDIGLQALGTGAIDPTNVKVVVKRPDGSEEVIRKHRGYGWSLDDASAPTKVLLRGKACNDLRATPGAVARVEIACK